MGVGWEGAAENLRLGVSSHMTLFLLAGSPVLIPDCWKVRAWALP